MRRALLIFAALMFLGGIAEAAPPPSGTLTLTDTTPVTFTATTDHVGRRDHIWVSTSCFNNGERTYYGEEVERNGSYVMDDTVWVLWIGTVAEGSCRALLIFSDEHSPSVEIVLYDTGWFTAP